jgi:hypothetical protein
LIRVCPAACGQDRLRFAFSDFAARRGLFVVCPQQAWCVIFFVIARGNFTYQRGNTKGNARLQHSDFPQVFALAPRRNAPLELPSF